MLKSRLFLFLSLLAPCGLGFGCAQADSGLPERPNVVLILADDLGWRDVGYNGSTFYSTPHIDQLASHGLVFDRAYAASPVCSPTRASLLTGKHPARLRLTKALVLSDYEEQAREPAAHGRFLQAEYVNHVPPEEATLAERLRAVGYRTALVGKWHLGMAPHTPQEAGFELSVGGGIQAGPQSYFSPYGLSELQDGPPGEYLTDRLTDEACALLRQLREEPFFLCLSHYAVHNPYQAKSDKEQRYLAASDPDAPQRNPTYAAMIESLDEGVGKVLATLAELELDERTIVVFLSDNGAIVEKRIRRRRDPITYPVTSNLPLRGGKGSLYEGGLRVPLVVSWPGMPSGGQHSVVPVVSMDLYPTLLELCGVPLAAADQLDGATLAPLLSGRAAPERESLFFHFPHQKPQSALRRGRYKLLRFWGAGTELFDLEADEGEQHDLASERPELLAELDAELDAWLARVDAALLVEDPLFEPRER